MQLTSLPAARPELPPITVEFRPNPNYGAPHGDQLLASFSAGRHLDDTDRWVRPRWGVWNVGDQPVARLEQGSFDDAVRAATELVARDRASTKWGLFGRHQGRVDAVALLEAGRGWHLVRVNVPLDPFIDIVPGGVQRFTNEPARQLLRDGAPRRERSDVAALVGATTVLDLRATTPSGGTEPFAARPATR